MKIYKISKLADKITKNDKHIFYKTPINFLVKQLEYKSKSEKINIGKKQKITINIYKDEIDKQEHKKGLLPNFIHSLDATHLFLTINRAKKEGLTHFITVHDSFATYPNDMEKLSKIVREEFINLHSKKILEDFLDDISDRYDIKLKIKIPYIDDDFDLNEIKKSEYFFA
jgi:DNA-directed RNA polymerase